MSGSQAGPILIPSGEARNDWRYRAILALRGNQTQLGCVLIAVLRRSHLHGPPKYAERALITRDGVVCAKHMNANGRTFDLVAIMTVKNLVDEWHRLADKIKATDAERPEMFDELRKWIVRDDRGEPNRLE